MNPGDRLIQVVYSSRYAIDIRQHIFSIEKYQHICDRLVAATHPRLISSVEPQVASLDQLAPAHTGSYLEKVHTLTLSPAEIAGLELPLTEAVVGGFRLMTGGTVTAASLALADGIAAHIAGVGSTTPSRTTARGSVCSTTWRGPFRCSVGKGPCRAPPSWTWMSITATAPR